MRKLWPFLGLALAVAAGVAVAPYFWWVAAAVALGLLVRARPGLVILVALFGAWAAWLADRDQMGEAAFVLGLLVLLIASPHIVRSTSRAWTRFIAEGVDPPDV